MTPLKATLKDGSTVEYLPEVIGEGGMKQVYFTVDKKSVVCFFKEKTDANRLQRLESVIGRYNPTTNPTTGDYWKTLFCWPTGIITSPQVGVLAPVYPGDFIFAEGPWKGREKKGKWFTGRTGGGTPLRNLMPASERGTWITYFSLCIRLARAIRRLHAAGLAHSDLSCNNVLIDPARGQSIVIDIDSLVVPGIYPPDVLGTSGYIAPEVLSTHHLKLNDPSRKHPSARTDQHALAVLIYEYLFFRHPLVGPKVHVAPTAEQQAILEMGEKALFIEDPTDRSNRPADLKVPYESAGPHLATLIHDAFVKGLHHPNARPAAGDWERALMKTWDLLHPCRNASCAQKWFVLHDPASPTCPFCGTRVGGTVPVLSLRREGRPGQWFQDGKVVVYDGLPLFKWHIYTNVQSNESTAAADRVPVADFAFHQGQWILINRSMPSLTSAKGNRVPVGQAVALADGVQIRLDAASDGRLFEAQITRG